MDHEEAKKIVLSGWTFYSEGNYEKAFPLLTQGAEAGFIPAYTLVGDCYWNGQGVEADSTKAIQYYLYAANLGDADALMRMGDVYLCADQPEKALESYEKAAEKGVTDALFNLGNIYYRGTASIERSFERAADYLSQYIDAVPDDAEAIHLLGRCYCFMRNQDLHKAETLFTKAASLGNSSAAKDLDALQLGGSIIEY